MKTSFAYTQIFENIAEFLCCITVKNMRQLYNLFESGDEDFCSFIKTHAPKVYDEYFGKKRHWAMFFWKLYSENIEKNPENKILKILIDKLKKAYEEELVSSAEQEFDIVSSVEKRYIDIEFGKEKSEDRKTVKFGMYPFFEDGAPDSISWFVLSENDDKMLLVSCQGIDTKPFNETSDNNNFNSSSLSKWLKEDFYSVAFNAEEKNIIDVMPFILDADQAEKYFASNEERLLYPTPYAVNKGIPMFKNGSTWWWLATPGSMKNCAAYVNYNGKIKRYGDFVFIGSIAVRPAIVINKRK